MYVRAANYWSYLLIIGLEIREIEREDTREVELGLQRL